MMYAPGPLQEMTREDIEALRNRCLERVGYDYVKAEKLVAAYMKGRSDADAEWLRRGRW